MNHFLIARRRRPSSKGATRRLRPIRTFVSIALAWVLLASPAAAVSVEGVEFEKAVSRSDGRGQDLVIHGVGLLRYKLLFRAYVAALYLPDGTPGAAAMGDVPKRLEISYFWAIEGDDFGRAANQLLAQQRSAAQLEPLRDRLATMHGAFRSIEAGQRYALTYEPGVGTVLSLDGEALATIPGADFAEAYFGIWLGERAPLDAGLRDELLGGNGT